MLLHLVSEMGTAQNGAWATQSVWMLLQASPDLYRSGMFPVPTEAWVLSKKAAGWSQGAGSGPCKMSSPGTLPPPLLAASVFQDGLSRPEQEAGSAGHL